MKTSEEEIADLKQQLYDISTAVLSDDTEYSYLDLEKTAEEKTYEDMISRLPEHDWYLFCAYQGGGPYFSSDTMMETEKEDGHVCFFFDGNDDEESCTKERAIEILGAMHGYFRVVRGF